MINLSKNSTRWFFLTGLVFSALSAIVEILIVFNIQQDWGTLLSIEGLLTILAYIALLILGSLVLVFCFFRLSPFEKNRKMA